MMWYWWTSGFDCVLVRGCSWGSPGVCLNVGLLMSGSVVVRFGRLISFERCRYERICERSMFTGVRNVPPFPFQNEHIMGASGGGTTQPH